MIQYENSIIEEIITHFVGNKVQEDGVIISKAPVSQTEELRFVLRRYLLSSFDTEESWHFSHSGGDVEFNYIYGLCREVFRDPSCVYEKSVEMAKFLYEKSEQNKIKAGDFSVVFFREVMLDGDSLEAIGLFKSEEKDTFLKVVNLGSTLNLETEKGINTHKLDKGALIFNTKREDGYIVKVVDNTNKSDAKYWNEDFLGLASCQNEYSNTKHAMAMAKNFVTKELPKEYEISKNDQITLLGKTLDYFKGNEAFSMDDFSQEVFGDPEVADTFSRYKEQYEARNDVHIEDSFGISGPACERQQRVYKRVIKLDNNVRIYISGKRDNVVQGEDEYGKFYKVYYQEESI